MWGLHFSTYTLLLFLHVAAVVVGMGTAVFMHIQFVRRSITWGTLRHFLPQASLVIWATLGIATITGAVLWIMRPSTAEPIFFVKVGLVVILYIEGIVIARHGTPKFNLLKHEEGFYDLPMRDRMLFYSTGALSVLGWWGALFIAILR